MTNSDTGFGDAIDGTVLESLFIDLSYEPRTTDSTVLARRRRTIGELIGTVTSAYEFYQLAGFLRGDPSLQAQEMMVAALRLSWLLRGQVSPGDEWDDDWWFESLDNVLELTQREELRLWAGSH